MAEPGGDYEAVDVPDASYDLFPAGKVFYQTRKGERIGSTHLNVVVDAPGGGFMVTPMLVPGQKDIGRLLRGERATDEQMDIAVQAAITRGNITRHSSVDDALKAEQEWRRIMIPKIEGHLKQRELQGVP